MDLLRGLTARVRWGTGLALAGNRLHVVILVRFGLHVRVAIPQRCHRGNSAGEGAHGMMGPLKGELPVGYLVRVTASPTRTHTDQVPAAASLRVRLRHPIRVLASVAAQLLRILRVFVGPDAGNYNHAQNQQKERRGETPGKSVEGK